MEYKKQKDRIILTDESGKTTAVITFPEVRPGVVVINHTEVDPSLEGRGIAGQLTKEAAEYLRSQGVKAELSCSYAVHWFSRHPEYQDLLADPAEEARKAAMFAGPACGIRR